MIKNCLILLSLVLYSHNAIADIYKWIDDDGNTHFTDTAPKNIKTKKVTVKINSYKSVKVYPVSKQASKIKKITHENKKVTMYSAEWCGVCRKAKQYFKQKKISYKELDIDKNKEAKKQYKKLNARGIPVIFVNKTRLNGFSVAHFEQVYYH